MRYVFQFDDNESEPFSEAREFADPRQARDEAVRELSYLMSSRLPDGEHRLFTVSVLDDHRATIYVASLRFDGQPTPAGGSQAAGQPEYHADHG